MGMTGLEFADRTLQKTHAWIHDIEEYTGREDAHVAYQELRAVLQTLRDRLPLEEAVDFGAQLPMLVRGFYYEGWRPSETPHKVRHADEFVSAVQEKLSGNPQIDPNQAIQAVLHVLDKRVTEGEMQDVRSNMPEPIRQMWPAH